VGANYLYPDRNLLVIDAGTAITYDVVNSANNYVGGNISLGMDMRFKALHAFTSKLPLVASEHEAPLTGGDTREAIWSGVVNGLTYEIDGFIESFSAIYPKLLVFLTGGNAKYFEKRIKYCNFVVPNLLSLGLNRILTLDD
jgi:type III pantothenate kinase